MTNPARRLLFLLPLLLLRSADAAPKLVVLVSIDQVRADYLTRFREHFGTGGFRLFMERGAWLADAAFAHAATSTGPGHAVIATGSYGWQNGIIGNSWHDAAGEKAVYCVADPEARIIGGGGEGRSPRNLFGTTLGDELRIATGFRGKVLSVSHKDRSAILLGGKLAQDVYWWADTQFVTSTYYRQELPDWVRRFNAPSPVRRYLGRTWERALPESAYALQGPDDAPWEEDRPVLGRTFPHPMGGDPQGLLTAAVARPVQGSPFGLELMTEFALAGVDAESLGRDAVPDLLCISYSTPDYVGHWYGPQSHEVLDIIVRMDRALEVLLKELDSRIGMEHVLVAVTSDHAVSPIPEYLLANHVGVPAGRVPADDLRHAVSAALDASYGKPGSGREWVAAVNDGGLYLEEMTFRFRKLDRAKGAEIAAAALLRVPRVVAASTRAHLLTSGSLSPLEARLRRSLHPARSGDVLFALEPLFTPGSDTAGADHGSPVWSDAHVPVLFLGPGIRPGRSAVSATPADIAPTLALLLGIGSPALREGRVLDDILMPHP